MFNQSGRGNAAPSRAPLALSVVLHLALGLGVVYLASVDTTPPQPLFRTPRPSVVYIPLVPIEIPAMKLAELPAPKPAITEEPAPPRPMSELAPVFENRRAEAAKPIELPVEPPPVPAPKSPAPPKPEVTVGTFASTPAPVRTPEPTRQIEIAGFDRAANKPVEPKPAMTAVGAFDRAAPGSTPPQTSRETVVADAGFNRSTVAASTASEGRVVRDTGFGNTNSREKPRAAETPTEITPVGFDRARTPQKVAGSPAPPPAPKIIPVEVLSKPTPIYTEEARKLRIEGDVLLEVEFTSTGAVRVLRIVRGLGHGLDEAATQAAQQIRFKPAQDQGRAVDSRATVNIVFRLA